MTKFTFKSVKKLFFIILFLQFSGRLTYVHFLVLSKYKLGCNINNVKKVVLFGSRARGDNSPGSDIDLARYCDSNLVEFIEDIENNTRTLLEFDFSNMSTVKDKLFIDQVNKEGITIYEKC